MSRETPLQRKIKQALRRAGAFVVKYHGSPYSERGIPDLLVCLDGVFIGLEIKAPGAKTDRKRREQQRFQREAIHLAGGAAEEVNSVEDALAVCEDAVRDVTGRVASTPTGSGAGAEGHPVAAGGASEREAGG